jgi:hypothetical protein
VSESASRKLPRARRASSSTTPGALGRLLLEDALQARRDRLLADQAELHDLAARAHRLEQLLRLGRREQELDVRRRLLERLEQRV